MSSRERTKLTLLNRTGSFAPVTLEQLARESGVLRSDGVTPCLKAAAEEGGNRLTRLLVRAAAEEASSSAADDKDQCIVRPFGRETSTASFALYTFSIAVFLQALVLITFSPVADYGMAFFFSLFRGVVGFVMGMGGRFC